ncbi:hypothetical protein AKJ09_04220 [Labilithrix luteola]|uniref:Sulfatase N-terminal domain-containing protein n=1 Tax=Labilithrix luteola TaxID=1391654 RepID=A0A0K1PVZ1_9BACT|nr:sulfatase-like hydrolase/transferase [Labilithrix luteola]AKU97556.1 hypothetical protein AKJ09_04220 [Labilithrix luteola]
MRFVSIAPLFRAAHAALAALAAVVALPACSRSNDSGAASSSVGNAASSSAVSLAASTTKGASSGPSQTVVLDFVNAGPSCSFGHRGTLLDLGDSTMRSRMSVGKAGSGDVEIREREGSNWVSMRGRSLALSFVTTSDPKADNGVVVEARMRGGAAKSASIFLNGKPLGVLPLTKGETKTVSARAASVPLLRGANELLVRLNGGGKGVHDELAEIDWIRVGPIDDDTAYAAPTRNDAIATIAIGGLAKRSITLRAPGFARCSGFIPNGAVLEGQIGVTGGEAEAEVRIVGDRAEPRVIGSFKLGGEESPAWRPISLPLGDVGTLAGVELVAKSSTKGARVVFAEPRVLVPATPAPPKVATSRGVIVVVLGTVAPKSLSPYGGAFATPELADLAQRGAVFETHRASTTLANGAVASMLTGLLPREHGVADPTAALNSSGFTIAEAARQAGVVTAMFTANPTTGAAFGFSRGWETFVAHGLGEENSSTALFEDVSHWLDGHKDDRFLVVVHARAVTPRGTSPARRSKSSLRTATRARSIRNTPARCSPRPGAPRRNVSSPTLIASAHSPCTAKPSSPTTPPSAASSPT